MVKTNFKLAVGAAALLILLFSGVVVRYALKKDPLSIQRSDKSSSLWGDLRQGEDRISTDGETDGENSHRPEEIPVVTQSTQRQDNRRSSVSETESEADSAKEKAGRELDAAAEKYDRAADTLNAANAALDNAISYREDMQAEFDDAKDRLDAAKEDHDESRSADYSRGLFAFLESIGEYDALDTLNGSDFLSAVDPADPGDAAALESLAASIELLEEVNRLRAEEGREELKVSCKLMALAALNNDMSAVNERAENDTPFLQLAAFDCEDPFELWCEDLQESLVSEEYAAAGSAFSSKNGYVHGLLLADADSDVGTLMTVSELSEKFSEFYDQAIKGKGCSEEQEEYDRAEQALKDAADTVEIREQEAKSASDAYDLAKKAYEEKLKAYEELADK